MVKEKPVNSKVKSRFGPEKFITVKYTRKVHNELMDKIENKKGTDLCKFFCESTGWCMHGTKRDMVNCKGNVNKCESKAKPKKK